MAFHEVGHALLSEHVRPGSVASITIASRSQALGYIRQNPKGDQYLYTRDQLVEAIQICVAGAVSEELIYGQRSTGAVGDIEQATELAKRMVFAGLSPLGIVSTDLSGDILHKTIAQIIREQEESVRSHLQEKLGLIRRVTARLLEEESLTGEVLRALMGAKQVS